jgi:hypothetical protein
VRSLQDVLDMSPAIGSVLLVEPAICRITSLQRRSGGAAFGVDAPIPPGRAVQLEISSRTDLVVAGSADPRHAGTLATASTQACRMEDQLSLPYVSEWGVAFEGLCGVEGRDWVAAGNRPSSCTEGIHDPAAGSSELTQGGRHGGDPEREAMFVLGRLEGWNSDLDPIAGHRLSGARGLAPRQWVAPSLDAGVDAACRCADADADGSDDCTERLEGTDPSDPASFGPDADRDGIRDADDGCPVDADPLEADRDADGVGDACDPAPDDASNAVVDPDGDGVWNGRDWCPDVPDPDQADTDFDRTGDACDTCPWMIAPQDDRDGDGMGDACDSCPSDPAPDPDGDGTCTADNCPATPNRDQADLDGDGFGDACDCPEQPSRPALQGLRVTNLGFVQIASWPPVPGEVYDVLAGAIDFRFRQGEFGWAFCVARSLAQPQYAEGPVPGDRFYIVRSRSACSATTWGAGSIPSNDPRSALDHGTGRCP